MSTTLTVLASFDGVSGSGPMGGLVEDAQGDLFGTTFSGTVFEILKTTTGYSSTPVVLASLGASLGSALEGTLFVDAAGNLIGTASTGGTSNDGTVFEIAKTASGYSNTPIILANFSGANGIGPLWTLVADSSGNLYGTTSGGGANGLGTIFPGNLIGASGMGTVFEIVKTASGYSPSPVTLANFNGANGLNPSGGLVIDSLGNLFGTTVSGGPNDLGTVFEIQHGASGYSATPTVLVNFASGGLSHPNGNLVVDSSGDLFGIAGASGGQWGAVFEIAKTATGYATIPTLLAGLNGYGGGEGLLIDTNGDLFVSSQGDGSTYGDHVSAAVLEIVKTAAGYSTTPTILANFSVEALVGDGPYGTLLADAKGNLFGTTVYGGSSGHGSVFEITSNLFQTSSSVTVSTAIAEFTAGTLPTTAYVTDSAANVSAGLDGLQSLVAAGQLVLIRLTDSGFGKISLTGTQLSTNSGALSAITGNYTLSISAGNSSQTVTGMSGEGNTAVFGGSASQYTLIAQGGGLNVGNGTVTDHVVGVQAVQFSDFTDIVAQTPGTATVTSGNIVELYGAAFGRLPDIAGLAYYETLLRSNPAIPLTTFAQFFLQSPEYLGNSAHTYAQTTAGQAQFITDLYQNLLHRAPESGAVPYYLNIVDAMTAGLTAGGGASAVASAYALAHAYIVTDFSQSAEYLADVVVTAQNPSSAQHWLVLI